MHQAGHLLRGVLPSVMCIIELDGEAHLQLLHQGKTNCLYETDLDDKARCGVHSFYCFHLLCLQLDMTDFKFDSTYILTP